MATEESFEHVRPPAVAGFFYPEDPEELRAAVDTYLAGARQANLEDPETPWPKAVIAPHAGFTYSGPVAASAYTRLEAARGTVRRVVLLGPSHRVGFRGLAVPSAEAYATCRDRREVLGNPGRQLTSQALGLAFEPVFHVVIEVDREALAISHQA